LTPEAIVTLHRRLGGRVPVRTAAPLQALCAWLNGPSFRAGVEEMVFPLAVMKAFCAHLGLLDRASFPWANGCTARLLEVGLFLQSNALPLRSAPLGTEHYQQTARRYRREVDAALNSRRPEGFIDYASSGVAYGMRRQLDDELQPLWMRRQWAATWESFARARLRGRGIEGEELGRCLALLQSLGEDTVDRERVLTAALLTIGYRGLDRAVVQGDLRTLAEIGLVRVDGRLCLANLDAVRVWPVPR